MSDEPKSTQHKESAGGVGPWLRAPDAAPHATGQETAEVGGLILADGDLEMNAGRATKSIDVKNTGDRPIQVGSHFHFFETNRYLQFDRPATFGMRLDIPAGTAVRFEPGDQKKVTLVSMGGKQRCYGFNDLVNGWTGDGPTPDYRPNYERAVRAMEHEGFKSTMSES